MVLLILLFVFASAALVCYALMDTSTSAWDAYSLRFTTTTESDLQKLFVFADGKRVLLIWLAVLVGVPLLLLFLALPIPLIIGVTMLLLMAPKFVLSHLAKKRKQRINEALPDALSQIAGAMRAGATFTTAMQSMVEEQKGPLGQEFSLLLREQRLGARLEDALDNLGERVQSEEMDLVITASLIAQEVGGNLAEILGRLSDTIRRKLEMEGKIRSLTAQGILQGRVVTMLPFLILGALFWLEPEATRPIYTGLLGWCFLAVILLLQVFGGLMIKKIVSIDI